MRRFLAVLSVITAASLVLPFLCFAEEKQPPDTGKAYVLLEANTGEIISSENMNVKLAAASLYKIMVLLLTAEKISEGKITLEDTVTCSAEVPKQKGSVIWLESGEKMKLKDLVAAVCISSSNDATYAIAEYLGGNAESFLSMMNKRAAELGMNTTSFGNVVGYEGENQYSCALDIAVVSAELMEYDYFDGYMTTRLSYVREDTDRSAQLLNTNKLASYYPSIRGIKAGRSDEAGYCVCACAEKNGMRLIAVVLGCEEDKQFDAAEYLLDTGFADYSLFMPTVDYGKLAAIPVKKGLENKVEVCVGNISPVLIPKGTSGSITYRYTLLDSISAEVAENQTVGEYTVFLGKKIIFSSDIVAKKAVGELTFSVCVGLLFEQLFR